MNTISLAATSDRHRPAIDESHRLNERRPVNRAAVERAARDLLAALGADLGVGVVLEAEHLCMSLRGEQKAGAKTVTSALHGLVRDDPRTRAEFLSLTGVRLT